MTRYSIETLITGWKTKPNPMCMARLRQDFLTNYPAASGRGINNIFFKKHGKPWGIKHKLRNK